MLNAALSRVPWDTRARCIHHLKLQSCGPLPLLGYCKGWYFHDSVERQEPCLVAAHISANRALCCATAASQVRPSCSTGMTAQGCCPAAVPLRHVRAWLTALHAQPLPQHCQLPSSVSQISSLFSSAPSVARQRVGLQAPSKPFVCEVQGCAPRACSRPPPASTAAPPPAGVLRDALRGPLHPLAARQLVSPLLTCPCLSPASIPRPPRAMASGSLASQVYACC
jgi:hypothetical protein